jgi:hypothetical protein
VIPMASIKSSASVSGSFPFQSRNQLRIVGKRSLAGTHSRIFALAYIPGLAEEGFAERFQSLILRAGLVVVETGSRGREVGDLDFLGIDFIYLCEVPAFVISFFSVLQRMRMPSWRGSLLEYAFALAKKPRKDLHQNP